MAVSTDIAQKANDIRTKVYGKDVRESLASGLESMSSDINQFKEDVNTDNENFKTDITAEETQHIQAESARVTAENGRVNAENSRVTAENGRVAAETARETAFSQMQHVDANAELAAARQGKSTLLENLQSKDSQLAEKATQDDLKIQPSPYGSFFGWTGKVDIDHNGTLDSNIAGEPFIIFDSEVNVYRMFYFGYDGTHVYCLSATAPSLSISLGTPWTKQNTNLSAEGHTDRHKMVILVDGLGNPVKINNKYHAYVVGYPSKDVYHWEADTLGSLWHETGIVVQRGFAGNNTDTFGVDAPSAIWDGSNVVLFYMAQPNASLSDFGLAHRTNRAISSTPDSGFIYDGCACTPSSNSGDWFYGWIGGSQPRLNPDGSWWIAINASNTRPTTAGSEDATSLWGMAKATTLRSNWTVDLTPKSYLPMKGEDTTYIQPNKPVESINVWRPFLIYEPILKKWAAYYNTGLAGQEKITHQIENYLMYEYNKDTVILLTTTESYIPCSRINLAKGMYKIKFECNIVGCETTLTHLDVGLSAYINNNIMKRLIFYTGNYNYDNVNAVLELPVLISQENLQLEFRVQIMPDSGGTPDTTKSRLRFYIITVEKM